MSQFPLSAVRATALYAQGLHTTQTDDPTPERIYQLVQQLGCVQIDTLHLVRRSQYLVLWSRLGTYDPANFDRLIYQDRLLFEYWMHAACIIPLTEYRYLMHKMKANGDWWWGWADQPDNRPVVEQVRVRVQQEGALRAADFEYKRETKGTWWDWKPAKRALEHLYNAGELMIANRINFQRVYDLRERVLPDWVDRNEPDIDTARRHLVELAARALGICHPAQLADYTHMKRGEAAPAVKTLIADGTLVEVEGELANGNTAALVVHRDTLPILERAADGAIRAERTTFLSPFDSLWWAQKRDEQFWNFMQRLEAYKPEPQRIWGYFCLAILWRDQLVGRFDPKLERKTNTLRLKAIYLEPGIAPSDELVADVAGALRDFMRFHDAQHLIIERSDPAELGDRLLAAV